MSIQISADRLFERLDALGQVGTTAEGGVRRLALSDADKAGRDLVVSWMHDLGLEVRIDQIGNIFGIREGTKQTAPIVTGSHIDTVYNGGNLDGNLGVLAGLEIVEVLNENSLKTLRPLIVAIFTNEEGARFQPDMMGSLVYAGGYDLDTALASNDNQGFNLSNELERIGYAGEMHCGEIVPHSFIELHIEQGPILEQENITIGVVENLQGISWTEITIQGQANHAGTTPMQLRHDAGYVAAAIATYVHDLALHIGNGQVATVGTIELTPNVINVVPGGARVTVDLRNANNQLLLEAEQRLSSFLAKLAKDNDVDIKTNSLARFDPVTFDPDIVELIENSAQSLSYSSRRITSGAGHDAQMMSRICPTAMIFIPSINGVSHNPAESTDAADIIAGANLLLSVILKLVEI